MLLIGAMNWTTEWYGAQGSLTIDLLGAQVEALFMEGLLDPQLSRAAGEQPLQ
jgi:tetracycline repressor-like protein